MMCGEQSELEKVENQGNQKTNTLILVMVSRVRVTVVKEVRNRKVMDIF